jgi:type II secretory pathway component GspD/PulD (secretin)
VKAKKWLGVVAGLALPAAGVGMAEGLAAVPATAARGADARVCQNLPRSRASTALNDGIDSYLKGDYEAAAESFKQVQAGLGDLAPLQLEDLKKFSHLNEVALQHRVEAAELVRHAEKAEREGRGSAAAELAQKALANQYAAAADRQKAQDIVNRARGTAAGAPAKGGTSVVARGKLTQARKLLAEGNLDAAEQLAREADRAGTVAGPGEDSPTKLLEEVAHTRQDPAALLSLARAALARGDLDRAEALAQSSKKAEPVYSVHVWGDSPSKVLDEVQAARTAKKQQPAKDVVKTSAEKDTPPAADALKGAVVKKPDALPPPPDTQKAAQATEQARQLMQQGRKALKDGQIDRAEECARRADALRPNVGWWEEDTPSKLLADAQAARASSKAAEARAMPADPRALLQKAHQALDAGKVDEAVALAQQAKIAPGAKDAWGLFDRDTPDNLIKEANKARAKHNQEESARLLAEGRKLLDQAEHDESRRGELLDAAQKVALKADALRNGNYSVWELGDRPSKLLADIDEARKKGHIKTVPPVPPPGSAVGSNDGAGRWPAGPPDDARVQQARRVMADARTAARAGNAAVAAALIDSVEHMNLPADRLGTDSPAAVRRELAALGAGAPAPPPTPGAPLDRAGNGQARALIAEARQLQGQGRLLEARARLLEAQRMSAVFGPDEDRPEKALLDLAGAARRQIDRLESQADDSVHHAVGDPQKYAAAEEMLSQAQALARGFQLDTNLIDKKLAWVRQTRGSSVAQAGPGGVQRVEARAHVTDGGPQVQGQQLLDQARMEIRAGNTGAARRLVEQVYAGNLGLRTEAENLLRSIDVEEYEQKRREQQRTFEAANSAFKRGDYPIAGRLLRVIDAKMLTPDQQGRMRELMTLPELQPERVAPVMVAQGPGPDAGPGAAATQNVNDGGDSREANYLKQVEGMREVKFQKMRDQEFRAEREARKLADSGETERAVEVLQEYLSQLPESGLDPDKSALLRRPVEAKLQQYRTLDAQKRFKDAQNAKVNQAKYNHSAKVLAEENKVQRIKELMDQYNALYKQAKYREAEMYAMQAQELDPDNPVAAAAVQIARMQSRTVAYKDVSKRREEMFVQAADEGEDEGVYVKTTDPLKFDKSRWDQAKKRKPLDLKGIGGIKSPKEREIEHRLDGYVSMSFNNVPLGKVIEELSTIHEINILPDMLALNEAGISLSEPLTFKVDNMTLRSALKNLLHDVRLTYVVEDEALKITTPNNIRGKMILVPYQVTELVIPISEGVSALASPNGNPNPMAQAQSANSTPVTTPFALTGGSPTGSPGGSTFGTGGSAGGGWDSKKSLSPTREDQLIQLIQNTVQPKSWASMGGQGTIDYFPMTMTLVINQTPDIQEQIADLLAALRRLQDAEVAVEIRLISIAEGFFERIGVDFNINIVNDKGTQKFQPMITSGQFKPAGFINDFTPQHFLSGLTPAGTFTSDLGIPITTSSYGMAIPPFGGFPNIPGGNGGIDLGLAFLSDIQVYMFLEAAQGDQRTNVMQAPKLTLFNGQRATLTVSDQQFFVTSATVYVVNGSPVFVPSNQQFSTGGIVINVQAVISADRRFVRMNFDGVDPVTGRPGIAITNLASATVPLFPIVQLVPTVLDGGITTSPVAFTQFFQQPVFNTVSVVTTVAVPDGGTVLLGGLKRLSEGRNEFGPPVLSKIPYLDRLFRNVGYGREVQNLMMMVTPRIIINAEEEERQTGVAFGAAAEGR